MLKWSLRCHCLSTQLFDESNRSFNLYFADNNATKYSINKGLNSCMRPNIIPTKTKNDIQQYNI